MEGDFKYQRGFGNQFATEALPNALPVGQNTPQKVAYGLYAEQLSGTAFTAPRSENQRSWLYRIRPSVLHSIFKRIENRSLRGAPFDEVIPSPNQLRWDAPAIPREPTDFVEGLMTMAGNGSIEARKGCAAHLYVTNRSMVDRFFYNADGDLLLVPQQGKVVLRTEFGVMELSPGEIGVVQRGIKFQVLLSEKAARGYVCENYGQSFRLPYLGPIGGNGLANPRDFLSPVASYEEKNGKHELVAKFQGNFWVAELDHSPLDVVAWHGNYAPYKYDLKHFQVVNTVSFDHPDPSIFTVLTAPSEIPGVANVDFVIFPPRWMVAEHTFRPPYYHRNCMSEFMGLIYGVYDAKETGFSPGGSSLHNCMSAHGPDAVTYENAVSGELKPHYLADTLAIMFESSLVFCPTAYAMHSESLQKDYPGCWRNLKSHFNHKG